MYIVVKGEEQHCYLSYFCFQVTVSGAQQVIDDTLKEGATTSALYYAVAAAKFLNLKGSQSAAWTQFNWQRMKCK